MNVTIHKSCLNGSIRVPGSKSHTIRAVLLAACARGTSVIRNPLTSGDGLSALNAARTFGAGVIAEEGAWKITGNGGNIRGGDEILDTGNSGTTTNFAMGIAALGSGYTIITGDYQIRRRPVKELVSALEELGAHVFVTRKDSDAPPVVVGGTIKGGTAHLSGFNSQPVSSLLIASPLACGDTNIVVDKPLEKPYIRMTLDWMTRYGVTVSDYNDDFTRFHVTGGQRYRAVDSSVGADWSAVAFPLVAAVCSPSTLTIEGLDFDDAQGDKAVVEHLRHMGAHIRCDNAGGTLTVIGGTALAGGAVINLKDTPDALPALAVAACFADGDTVFTDLAHVRVKETDRVAVCAEELGKMGAAFTVGDDTLVVHGNRGNLKGAAVESRGDHRIAMALTAAGLCVQGETRLGGAECADVSFPGFFDLLRRSGAGIVAV